MFREAIRKVCVGEFRCKLVGESDSGATAIEVCQRTKPDVVILDLSLPDLDGFEVAVRLKRQRPAPRILVLTAYLDPYTIFRVERANLEGFVAKNTDTIRTLRLALTALANGGTYFSPAFQSARAARRADPMSFEKLLSATEQTVLASIGRGANDNEIARHLGISPCTAQTHRSNILRKLKLPGTPKLMAFAIESGFAALLPKNRGSFSR